MAEAPSSRAPRIRISVNGPYLVSGRPILTSRTPVRNAAGEAVDWAAGQDRPPQSTFALCRCGHSASKPYCDGSHERVGFVGTCTADPSPGEARRKIYRGVGITITDDESLCAGYEYCDRGGGVWRTIGATADPAVRSAVTEQVAQCPSGRLQYIREGSSEPEERAYPATIATIPDGPLWVLGGVPVVSDRGSTYEVRNRALLCRCGASANKPFCDGSHYKTGFKAP